MPKQKNDPKNASKEKKEKQIGKCKIIEKFNMPQIQVHKNV